MQDSQLESIFQKLVKQWAGNVLHRYPLGFGGISLRFELGDRLPNGTEARVIQAADRAATLFTDLFSQKDELLVIVQNFRTVPNVTTSTLTRYIEGFSRRGIAKRLIHPTEPDEDVLMEISAFRCHAHEIDAPGLFRAIANREMGIEPTLDVACYFLKPESHLAFVMYDDRGCVLSADDMSALKALKDKHSSWLVRD